MEIAISNPKKNSKSKILLISRIGISFIACFYLFYQFDLPLFYQQIKEVKIGFILIGFLLVLFCIIISGYKWFLLCRVSEKVTFYQCFKWYYIGFFFNNFLPGSIGGDSLRIYYASKDIGASLAFASVIVERFFAGIALILITSIGLLFISGATKFFWHLFIFVGLSVIIYCFLFVPYFQKLLEKFFGERLQSFYHHISIFQEKARLLVMLFLHSVLFQLAFVLITDMLFRSFGVELSFLVQLGFVSLISILTMLPISINGIGIREGAYAYFFAFAGVNEQISVAVSLLFFSLVLIGTSIGAVFWIREKKR